MPKDAVSGPRDPITASKHFARTTDGWRLALHRYHGGDERLPVILCPGYGCSGLFLDYDDRFSLARFLARRGFDAWVLDLRGRGESRPADGAERRRWRWTFDDIVRHDLPAAIERVRLETRKRRVVWIGHSMGGVALYAFVGTTPIGREAVAAAVTLGSPILLPSTGWRLVRQLGRLVIGLPLPWGVPQRELVSLLWSTIGTTGMLRVAMNPANVSRRLAGRALRRSLHNVSVAKVRQLARWSTEQVFCSADGTIDYRKSLSSFDVPLLAIAGHDDRLATPESVHVAIEEVASPDSTFLELAVDSGYSADYGHIDLVFGRRAPEEVFPKIGGWLAERAAEPRPA